MIKVFVAASLLTLAFVPAQAAEDEAGRTERWSDLRHAVFGNRTVQDAGELVVLSAPVQALDAALVPITITIDPTVHVKALYLTVDANPSPLVGTFHFGPAADPHSIKTRVRVEQYTLMHAVVETDDGRLLSSERFVKAAGGCSAPMGNDAKQDLTRLGWMRLHMQNASTPADASRNAQLLISHPNNNGMQVDPSSHGFIPARYIQNIKVTSGDETVFTMEADISLSEDPSITFGFKPVGAINVEVDDSTQTVFKKSFTVPQSPQAARIE